MSENMKEVEFPSSLTAEERKHIHLMAQQYGMESKSRGRGTDRYLTVYKKNGSNIIKKDSELKFTQFSLSVLYGVLQRFPVSNKERQNLLPRTEKDKLQMTQDLKEMNMSRSLGRLSYGPPQVPPKCGRCDATIEARKLPVWNMEDQLLKVIETNQVILVRGETGSGKTTQVPQVILDDCHVRKQRCRILCTQPRRISALSIAERVSTERVEKIGSTVGYQIRLEGRVSAKTLLTFCTTGILLRTLMGNESALSNVTHVLVDEVHERDRFTDFLLTVLRDALPKFRHLKLILMSANLDANLYAKYFSNCPIVDVPGRTYPVKPYFLEDVLKSLEYTTPQMTKFQAQLQQKQKGVGEASQWAENVLKNLRAIPLDKPNNDKESSKSSGPDVLIETPSSANAGQFNGNEEEESVNREDVDECIHQAFSQADDDNFSRMVRLVVTGDISPDYQHSTTLASPLMVASGRGRMDIVEQLLALGATVGLKAANEWMAIDWAKTMGHEAIVEYLQSYSVSEGIELSAKNEPSPVQDSRIIIPETSEEDKNLVEAYSMSTSNNKSSDTDLIYALCLKIHSSEPPGGLLIFLPGYEDIVALRDRIVCDEPKFVSRGGRYSLFCLHSHMQSSDQKRVFSRSPPGTRKIVLSTNIAETSVTIDDIVYVIDCGKVKEMSFDSLSSVSCLRPVLVSQASAMQRRGRAGRCQPGVAYHLVSRSAFNLLQTHQTPEILRSPLQDLCLHTKLLAMPNMLIADFLARAPEPPAHLAVKNAVQLLKSMDALDPWEEVTELGHHLLDLNLPPHLGKMVITATVLKCLDPVLTIATCLAFRDPFTLPSYSNDKRKAKQIKQKFSANSFSDHIVLLKAYQSWENGSSQHRQRNWCDRNYISSATLEMVQGMKNQVLAQLKNAGFIRPKVHGDLLDVNTYSDNWAVIKAALLSGAYPNLVRVDRQAKQLKTAKDGKVRLHSSCVLLEAANEDLSKEAKCRSLNAAHRVLVSSSLPTDWLMYDEMVRIGCTSYVKTVTAVSPFSVALMAGPMRLPTDALTDPSSTGRVVNFSLDGSPIVVDSDSEVEDRSTEGVNSLLKIDSWVQFVGKPQQLNVALLMRQKLYALILRKLKYPQKPPTQNDEEIVRATVAVLTEDEKQLGLTQQLDQNHRFPSTNSAPDLLLLRHFSDMTIDESPHPHPHPHPHAGYDESSTGQQHPPHIITSSNSFSNFSSVNPSPYMPNGYGGDVSGPRNGFQGSSIPPLHPADHMGAQRHFSSNPSHYSNNGINSSGIMSHSSASRSSKASYMANLGGAVKRFFVISVNSLKQVEVSQNRGLWSFSYNTDKKILSAAQSCGAVILIFVFSRSGQYLGFAKFWGQRAQNEICHELTNVGSPTGCVYRVEWIKKCCVPFHVGRHLTNPYADNGPIHLSRNGQEVEPSVGEQLTALWNNNSSSGGGGGDHGSLGGRHPVAVATADPLPQPGLLQQQQQQHILPYHPQGHTPTLMPHSAAPAFHPHSSHGATPLLTPPQSPFAPRPLIGYGLNFGGPSHLDAPPAVFRGSDSRR